MLVDAAHYHEGLCTAAGLGVDQALELHGDRGFVWLTFVDPSEDELLYLRETFGLHELVGRDILARHDRPKFEAYDDDVLLVVLRTAYFGADRRAHFGEIAVCLSNDFVVSARKGGQHAQGSARRALEARPDLLEHGVSAVLWAILDKVVSDLRPVVAELEETLVELEEQVFSDEDTDPTRRIFDVRRQLAQLYRAVHPMLGPLEAIERGAYPQVAPMRPYLRDVTDHAKLVHEQVVGQGDRLIAVLEASLALTAHRQNSSLRKISGWGAIIAVPTLVAGVYGMNFRSVPGSGSPHGFVICVAVMLLAAVALYVSLRRARWM
jgi:magnesium transporter